MENRELLVCDCESAEHQIIFTPDNEDPLVYATIHLSPLPFFKRVVAGVRYIFGYQSKYGAFEDIVLASQHAPLLRRVANQIDPQEH